MDTKNVHTLTGILFSGKEKQNKKQKNNAIVPFVTSWVDPEEGTMLSEISHTEENKTVSFH